MAVSTHSKSGVWKVQNWLMQLPDGFASSPNTATTNEEAQPVTTQTAMPPPAAVPHFTLTPLPLKALSRLKGCASVSQASSCRSPAVRSALTDALAAMARSLPQTPVATPHAVPPSVSPLPPASTNATRRLVLPCTPQTKPPLPPPASPLHRGAGVLHAWAGPGQVALQAATDSHNGQRHAAVAGSIVATSNLATSPASFPAAADLEESLDALLSCKLSAASASPSRVSHLVLGTTAIHASPSPVGLAVLGSALGPCQPAAHKSAEGLSMAAPYAAPGALAEPEPTRAAANGTEQAQLELQQASTLQVLSSLRMSDAGSKENGQIAAAALGASSNQPAVLIGLLLVQAQAAQPDPHFGRQQGVPAPTSAIKPTNTSTPAKQQGKLSSPVASPLAPLHNYQQRQPAVPLAARPASKAMFSGGVGSTSSMAMCNAAVHCTSALGMLRPQSCTRASMGVHALGYGGGENGNRW